MIVGPLVACFDSKDFALSIHHIKTAEGTSAMPISEEDRALNRWAIGLWDKKLRLFSGFLR
jgi:hypothetical protein